MVVAALERNGGVVESRRAAWANPWPAVGLGVRPVVEGVRPAVRTMAIVPTSWGVCGVVWQEREGEARGSDFTQRPADAALCRIATPGMTVAELRAWLMRGNPGCHEVIGDGKGQFHPEVVPGWFGELVRYLQGYYTTALREWTYPQFVNNWAFWKPRLDWSQVTAFQRQVLEEVAGIGCGERLTYGEVARRIGKPKASRAVGAALGANPWPVLVPCHRVVGAGGRMTGFSAPGGVETKRRMLAMEDGT